MQSVYIKSQNDFINAKNPTSLKAYDFAIFPVNGRAIPVSNMDINYLSNTVTFNNLISYNGTSNTVINVSTNTTIKDYFNNSYTGPRIYRNNFYESVISVIINKTIDINDPTAFLMYDSSGDQTIVTSIVDYQTYYRFTSSLGSIDFDKKSGVPSSTRFVVYKYDGYSHITKDFYDKVYNGLSNLQIREGDSTTYQVYYSEDFIQKLKVYIIHKTRKTDIMSHKIYRNYI